MKKDTLYSGLGFLAVGFIVLILYIFMRGEETFSIFAGLAGGLIGPGIMMIYKYFHWSKPENKAAYEERLKNEKINVKDERKVMIRGITAQVMYKITILILATLAFICSLIGVDKWIILLLAILLIFEVVGGHIVYRYYSKKM